MKVADELSQCLTLSIQNRVDPITVARLMDGLVSECGWSKAEIARFVGKSPRWVSARLELVHGLVPEAVEAVKSGSITPKHGRYLAKIHKSHQTELLALVTNTGMSTRGLEDLVSCAKGLRAEVPAIVEDSTVGDVCLECQVRALEEEVVSLTEENRRLRCLLHLRRVDAEHKETRARRLTDENTNLRVWAEKQVLRNRITKVVNPQALATYPRALAG